MNDTSPRNALIVCPNTGEYVPTGWFIDPATMDSLDMGAEEVHCARCHEAHAWVRSDVIWETF